MNRKEFFLHPTICPLPWSGLYLEPNGEVRNCSISKIALGNIKENNLLDICKNNKNLEIKQGLANGIKIASCKSCWDTENLELHSKISQSNRAHFKKVLGTVIPIETYKKVNHFDLKMVDLRWRNTCNLACVYCGSDLSSTWANELGIKVDYNEAAIQRTKETVFANIKNLSYVYLCGGEPLLMKENLELIDLIQKVNPDIYVRINTNLTNTNSPIYDKVLECKNVHWIISVESTKENFEFVRYGAKWESWLSGLKKLKQDIKHTNHKLSFNMTWCATTSFAIFDAVDCFTDLGFHPNSFIIQILKDPRALSVRHINAQANKNLQELIKTRLKNLKTDVWLRKGYDIMLAELQLKSDYDTKPFKNFIETLDKRRSTNGLKMFANLF